MGAQRATGIDTGIDGTAGEREIVDRAFRVQPVYVGSGIGSFTRGSIPSCESLRRCPCGVQ